MRKNIASILVLCFLFVSVFVLQVSAAEPRSYFYGCSDCGGHVIAFCDGPRDGSPFTLTHEYGGFLFWGKETCTYTEHIHETTEYCQEDPTHVNPGDSVHAIRDHVCGEPDAGDDPCGMHQVAYRSWE